MQQLFSEFKPTSAAEWKAQLVKDLKGEAFETLVWKNENGIDIQPFYTPEDLHQAYEPAFTHADWDICVSGKSSDAKALNHQLLQNLNSGATSVSIHCGQLDLSVALQDIQLNYIQATFYADAPHAAGLKNFIDQAYKGTELNASIFPERLNSAQDLEDWLPAMAAFTGHKNIRMGFDALPAHNGNCLAYYEVALIIAGLNDYLNAFASQQQPMPRITVKTGVNSDYFVQIAKLRAIRRLWNVIAAEYNIHDDLHLIVETSSTNKSISDSYNNLLRTTVEAMAAVSGGCNELSVTGFDLLFPVNNKLSERMAINQQLILKEESYFNRMADVACGSYYIESLTDALAARALETVKQLESQGGYFACLEKNIIPNDIAQQARQRDELVEGQKQIAIGVNKFKNEKEKIELSAAQLAELQQLPINNPVLNFELGHYFTNHA